MSTRVPYDPTYTAKVGAAIYVFAYYEWAVIYLIEQYQPGFVARYSRGKPMTSGQVLGALREVLEDAATPYDKVSREQLEGCCKTFSALIDLRNALIHAHPITAPDGSQILNYQSAPSRPFPDVQWPIGDVEAALLKFDQAAVDANALLHVLLPRVA
jgi:hypothetical protein